MKTKPKKKEEIMDKSSKEIKKDLKEILDQSSDEVNASLKKLGINPTESSNRIRTKVLEEIEKKKTKKRNSQSCSIHPPITTLGLV